MKRIITAIVVSILFVTFALSVFAANEIYILYKSINPFYVNGGRFTSEELPILNYEGNNYIPIRKAGEALGAIVDYDPIAKCVNITNKTNNDSSSLEDLKILSRIMYRYYWLEKLGGRIFSIGNSLQLASDGIKRNDLSYLPVVIEKINKHIEYINEETNNVKNAIKDAEAINKDVSDMNKILDAYKEAISYYEKSYNGIKRFSIVQNDEDFNTYLDNLKNADAAYCEGSELCCKGVIDYYNLLQNYK